MEQRKMPRSKLNSLIKVVDGKNTLFGEAVDISLSGLSCELPVGYSDNQPLLVSFRLEVKDRPITTWASPVWCVNARGGKYRVGMRFLDLDSNHYSKIADYVAANWIKSRNF